MDPVNAFELLLQRKITGAVETPTALPLKVFIQ
jgi:hypothetical protein